MEEISATLQEILRNKEERVKTQAALRLRFGTSLISLSINIPGTLKLCHESLVIYEEALKALHVELTLHHLNILQIVKKIEVSGPEAIFVIEADALILKKLTCNVELTHPLGRLMDIDVLDNAGNIVSREAWGYPKRKCYVCKNDAILCARSQRHPYELLMATIHQTVKNHAFPQYIAQLCCSAMQKEVELTPKAGLVDSANSGAHDDMDIHTFYTSIKAIKPYIEQFVSVAKENPFEEVTITFEKLRHIGVLCEQSMFLATQNINTHKGMIFCLAIVCGAIGKIEGKQKSCTCKALQTEIMALCHNLIDKDLVQANPHTAGAKFFYETGLLGIRGEAQNGFPTIFNLSLPYFIENKAKFGEEVALKKTLLLLMSTLDDSTLWSRGGVKSLVYVKSKSAKLLLHVEQNPSELDALLNAFDEELICLHLSPGGSADLLALTWLIAHIKSFE